ncbi:hypothetical protein [Ideonella sp. BN130291]|uniref:hypothetical protein n=1 Tax=Ideonella sp. BN130291 TaxID=3112940 RepID=UPI002E25FCD7|nr:hypothetical protein [Ideonella sp. BN130291]
MNDTPTTLKAVIDDALALHPDDAPAAVRRLEDGFALLPAAPEQAELFVRSLEHVLLGHRDDAAAYATALDRLAPAVAGQAAAELAVARGRLAITLLSDPVAAKASSLPAAETVRAHYNAALALTRRSAWPRVQALVQQAGDLAEHSGEPAAQKALAALTNNIAGDLRYYFGAAHRADAGRVHTMLDAAQRARAAWERAGGWMEVERADYQLALCHAVAGQGTQAVAHAQACLQRCEANGADAYERFFAQEALARAHCSADQPGEARRTRDRMAQLLAEVQDKDAHAFAADTLAALDKEFALA